jgi:hypothetical protein
MKQVTIVFQCPRQVCRSYQGIKNRFAEEFPEMDVERFGFTGAFFNLQCIQLRTIAYKIVVFVNAGSLPVNITKAIPLYIQKKRKRPFNIRPVTFTNLCMNDHTGKTTGIQRQLTPSQPVVKPMGYLVF